MKRRLFGIVGGLAKLSAIALLALGLVLAGCGDAESGPTGGGDTYGVSLKNGTAALSAHTFTDTTALTVTVSNTGSKATGALTIAKSGTNAASFTVSKTSISDIAVDGTDRFTVSPNAGLPVGSYTATVTVSGGNSISASFTVSYTVSVQSVTKVSFYGTRKNEVGLTYFLDIADTTLTWKFTNNVDVGLIFNQADVTGLTWGEVTKAPSGRFTSDNSYQVTVTGTCARSGEGEWRIGNHGSVFPEGSCSLTLVLVDAGSSGSYLY